MGLTMTIAAACLACASIDYIPGETQSEIINPPSYQSVYQVAQVEQHVRALSDLVYSRIGNNGV